MRSGVHPVIADMIVGHGNRKKDVQSVYLTVSNADLVAAIDRMKFDSGDTEIWVAERGNGKVRRYGGQSCDENAAYCEADSREPSLVQLVPCTRYTPVKSSHR